MKWLQAILLIISISQAWSQGSNPFEVRDKSVVPENIIESVDTLLIGTDQERAEEPYNPFNVRKSAKIESLSDKKEPVQKAEKALPQSTKRKPVSISDERNDQRLNRAWLGVFIFIAVVMAAFGVSVSRSRFNNLFESLYNSNTLKGLYRNNPAWFGAQSLLLYGSFIISASLFFYLVFYHYNNNTVVVPGFQIPLAIIAIYIIRHFTMAMLSYIFPLNNEGNVHNYSIGVHNMISCLLLIPVCLGMIFGPEGSFQFFMILGFIGLGLTYLLRQAKGLLMALSIKGFNPIYFFIYLCAVEIAPFLIVIRLAGNVA